MEEVRIKREAMEFILQASRNTYPDEFAGLLRKNKKGEIAEILVIPQTTNGKSFSSITLYNVGYTSHHCGSVHSHPGPSARPSNADLNFFRATGEVHIIVCVPFDSSSMRAYDSTGKELGIKIA